MLVVNPNNRIKTVKPDLPAIEPPLWAGLISSYYDWPILDAEAEDLTLDQTVDRIHQWNGNQVVIVVMGNNPSVSSTPKMPISEALAERLGDKYHVALTGIHPLAVGSKFPVMKVNADFPQGTGFPMQPWGKLPMNLYRAHMWHCLDGSPRSPYASIYTSLGCPFSCYYCNIHTLYGDRQIRFRPFTDVIQEFENVFRLGIRNVKIWDELFALKEDRVLNICHELEGANFNIWAYARLDTITAPMLKAMKKAGINWLAYGFESVTDPKFITDTERKIAMTREAGISIIANFMFGLPGATVHDDEAGLQFAKKHLFEFVNFYTAKPYPGSAWFETMRHTIIPGEGRKVIPDDELENEDWSEFDQYAGPPEFKNFAFKAYFSNPAYHSMLKAKWGDQAVRSIKEMLAWQK